MSEVTVVSAARQRGAMPLRGRSYMAFALTVESPIADWLAELDGWLHRSPGFFAGRPAVLDLAAVKLTNGAIAHLVAELGTRGIRIMAIEGAEPDSLGENLPPLVSGGRAAPAEAVRARSPPGMPAPPPEPTALFLDAPVRSGQAIFHPNGDVIVLGSVGSGAEVIASGSIHVYGTLRGRAMAGTSGNRHARIFCKRLEAELLAIDGFYRTAEDIGATLRNTPVQAWLADEALMLAALE
jgi:septum site-determining protein MinC